MDDRKDAVPVTISSEKERGDIFLRVVVGGLILFFLYAGLKRWRSIQNPPHH
jgi:hypothetical protein